MSTPLAVFGPGILIVTRTDVAIPAPINIGFAQEFSIEAAASSKQLYGQNQWPLAVARGTIKGTGKFKAATVSGLAWAALFYGQTPTTGGIVWNVDSTFTTSTTSTTVAVGSSLTFDADLGVRYASGNLPLQRVGTGSEATGKYSIPVATPNVYNFAAGDQGVAIKVTYTNTTTSGQSIIVANPLLGVTPTFQIDYYTNFNQPTAKPFVVRLYVCIAEKHMMQFKLEDFMIPEFDFSLSVNASQQVYDMVFPEVA